ncbi:24871_t:CDS:2 [Entrophospora sp. SA101]|nr:13466_t:CDS:2 [Entrophospora sp. SA101]CAJ0748334.1 24871_t:CDS:2 [Entrophospora sp. SA101]
MTTLNLSSSSSPSSKAITITNITASSLIIGKREFNDLSLNHKRINILLDHHINKQIKYYQM